MLNSNALMQISAHHDKKTGTIMEIFDEHYLTTKVLIILPPWCSLGWLSIKRILMIW